MMLKDGVVGFELIGGKVQHVDGAVAHLEKFDRLIRNDPEYVAGDWRLPEEIIGIGFEQDILRGFPLLELIGTRTDGSAVGRMRLEVTLLKNMFRDDPHAPRRQTRSEGPFIDNFDRIRV